jgi:hypothetical protein
MMEGRKRKLGQTISQWIDAACPENFIVVKNDVCDFIDANFSDWDFWRRYYFIEEKVISYLENKYLEE